MLLELGPHRFDVTHDAMVVGIVPGWFQERDGSSQEQRDRLLGVAARHVDEGADALEVGPAHVHASTAADDVEASHRSEGESETAAERMASAVACLRARFDVPLSCATSRTSVLEAALGAGAVAGNDRPGPPDAGYLDAAAGAGASVTLTHRWPHVPDGRNGSDGPDRTDVHHGQSGRGEPDRTDVHHGGHGSHGSRSGRSTADSPDDVVAGVSAFLSDGAGRARSAGIPGSRIVLDLGIDACDERRARELLRASDRLVGAGHLGLSLPSGVPSGGPDDMVGAGHREMGAVLVSLGVMAGCRVVRTHDVRSARRTCVVLAAMLRAREAGR